MILYGTLSFTEYSSLSGHLVFQLKNVLAALCFQLHQAALFSAKMSSYPPAQHWAVDRRSHPLFSTGGGAVDRQEASQVGRDQKRANGRAGSFLC